MTDYKAKYEIAVRLLKRIKNKYDGNEEYAELYGTYLIISGDIVQDIKAIIGEHDKEEK